MPSIFVATRNGPIEPNLFVLLETGPAPAGRGPLPASAERCLGEVWRRFAARAPDDLAHLIAADGAFGPALARAERAEIAIEVLTRRYGALAQRVEKGIEKPAAPKPAERPAQRSAEPAPPAVPAFTADGRAVRKWAPKRRVY